MYTLKQMEAFYWSATLGSFSASAKRLHATQSAIAKRVVELETFVGVPLFERRPKALILTQPGRRLVKLAEQMLSLNSHIVQQMADTAKVSGTVRLGATELVGLTWLARLINQVKRRYSDIELLPHIDGGVTLYENLSEGNLDLVIMPGPFWSHEFDSVHLGSVENSWMSSPKLNIDFDAVLTGPDLAGFPVITQPTNSALSYLYGAWFAEQDINVNRVLTCNSLGIVAQLTMLGLGISYLPVAYFSHLEKSGDLRRINVRPTLPDIHYYIVHRKGVLSPLLSIVVELAHETCNFDVPGMVLLGTSEEDHN